MLNGMQTDDAINLVEHYDWEKATVSVASLAPTWYQDTGRHSTLISRRNDADVNGTGCCDQTNTGVKNNV